MAEARKKRNSRSENDYSNNSNGGLGLSLGFQIDEPSESTDILDPKESCDLMCVYDFDQTITVTHVYNTIMERKSTHTKNSNSDGGGDDDADDSEVYIKMKGSEYLEKHIKDEEITGWFGDADRLNLLKKHFEKMRELNVECRILSLNEVKTVQRCLQATELSSYFSTICGNDTPVFRSLHRKKNELLKKWIRANPNLTYDDVVFIDDDAKHIKAVNHEETCLTVRINEKKGMSKVHCRSIQAHFERRREERKAAKK